MTFVNQGPISITSNGLQERIVWLQSSVLLVVEANFQFFYFIITSTQKKTDLTEIRLKIQCGRKSHSFLLD